MGELNCIGCGVKGCDGKVGCDYYDSMHKPISTPTHKCCEHCDQIKDVHEPHSRGCPISIPTEGWREALEKIAWKHYDPHSSINVEEMLDEMAPVITQENERSYLQGRKEAEEEMLWRFQKFWAVRLVAWMLGNSRDPKPYMSEVMKSVECQVGQAVRRLGEL